jgi:hypothetical protein
MSAIEDLKLKRRTPLSTCVFYVEKYGGSKSNRETAEKAAAELAAKDAEIADLKLQLTHYEIGAEEEIAALHATKAGEG